MNPNLVKTPVTLSLLALLVVEACSFAPSANAHAIPGMGTWESTLHSRDLDGDGHTDAYYDSQLNITWLDIPRGGGQLWPNALNWVAAVDIGGITSWRMPRTFDPLCNLNGPVTNCGNLPNPASSELAHLYYITLGHLGHTLPSHGGMLNGGPFTSLSEDLIVPGQGEYWSETEGFYDFPVTGQYAWRFSLISGDQAPYGVVSDLRGVFAVHDGDVLATVTPPNDVPEPSTLLLTAAALLGLGVARRKHSLNQAST